MWRGVLGLLPLKHVLNRRSIAVVLPHSCVFLPIRLSFQHKSASKCTQTWQIPCYFIVVIHCHCSRDSSVGIATRYGLEGPGIESRWVEVFHAYPDRLRGPSNLLHNGYRVFPGSKGGRSVILTTHSLLVPRLRKS
jgi:hypothetical protein